MTLQSIQLSTSPQRFSLALRKTGERNVIDLFTRRPSKVTSFIASPATPIAVIPALPVSAETDLISLYALTDIGGHRLLVSAGSEQCSYADSSIESHGGKVIGLSIAAASRDTLVRINTTGTVDEQSWNWIPDEDLWVGRDGLMTQDPPADGAFVQRIGYALSPTRIRINLDDPIFL